jgi:hypothetical protein
LYHCQVKRDVFTMCSQHLQSLRELVQASHRQTSTPQLSDLFNGVSIELSNINMWAAGHQQGPWSAYQEKVMARVVDQLHLASFHLDLSKKSVLHIAARDALILFAARWTDWSDMRTKSIRGPLAQRLIAAFQYDKATRNIKLDAGEEALWSLLGHAKYKTLTPGAHWERRRNRRKHAVYSLDGQGWHRQALKCLFCCFVVLFVRCSKGVDARMET